MLSPETIREFDEIVRAEFTCNLNAREVAEAAQQVAEFFDRLMYFDYIDGNRPSNNENEKQIPEGSVLAPQGKHDRV